MATTPVNTAQVRPDLSLAYRESLPPSSVQQVGTIILIHGFPQTSYQFRNVLPLLSAQGYRCIAPDYRGAGDSSKPASDFTKATMAEDIRLLLQKLEIPESEPIHIIGHDIGGMVAFSLAHRNPSMFRTVCWGECPLPGTKEYYREFKQSQVEQFHFIFHRVPELPEALLDGKERVYVDYFLKKKCHQPEKVFTKEVMDEYVEAYEQADAMRCALGVYRSFPQVWPPCS
jgi:pimeloyl-ACP methyl ester carboxylesterase